MLEEVLKRNKFVIAGHRGYRSLYPENTLLAFHEAIARGVDMLEIDLQLTSDNHVVIIHDLTIDRTTTSTGKVKEFTLAELKTVDAGSKKGIQYEGIKIPTFREFCAFCKRYPNLLFNIEIKDRTFNCVDEMMKVCEEFDIVNKSVFTCFDATIIGYMYDRYGLKTQGFPKEKMFNFVEGLNGTNSKLYAIGISMDLLTQELVNEFKEQNIETWSYAPDTMQEIIKSFDLGITLVTVNDVTPALEYAIKNGLR